jgi:sugar phosphate isomerase/epimerase
MQDILDRYQISIMEVELLTGWAPESGRDAAQRQKEETVFRIARRFGADHANAGLFEQLPLDLVTDAFAALCRRAGEVKVALEFMPFGGLPDLAAAWKSSVTPPSRTAGC